MRHRISIDDAAETWRCDHPGPVLLSCDHASCRMPRPWRWPVRDLWVVGTHWSYDLGAARLTADLAGELQTCAVLSRFSRLLVDPNRRVGDPSLIRIDAEDRPLALNEDQSAAQRQERLDRLYFGYHRALEQLVLEHPGMPLLSIHTFTREYEGQTRTLEGGILFDAHESRAHHLQEALAAQGFDFALNEPYSGYDGLIEGIAQHGTKHQRVYLELEVRQDIAQSPARRTPLVKALAKALIAVFGNNPEESAPSTRA